MSTRFLAGWTAWINNMPGIGNVPTLYIKGGVMAPTPCHKPVLVHDAQAISVPETRVYNLLFEVKEEICKQIVVPKEVDFSEPLKSANGIKSVLVKDGANAIQIQVDIIS